MEFEKIKAIIAEVLNVDENEITMEDVKDADIIILTKDVSLSNTERFTGKPIVKVPITDVVKKSDKIIIKIEEAFKNR